MDFTVSGILFTADYSSFLVALAATLFCFLLASAVVFRRAKLGTNPNTCELKIQNPREDGEIDSGQELPGRMSGCRVGGGMENGGEKAVDRQTGTSMMEQLVPEITTHALSYLDYPSLCRLSMTNSLMRKAANDDNAWKALYRKWCSVAKDFTLEQDNVIPPNGWKAYYAATRAIVNVNSEFFGIIRERSLQAMGQFWLNADYVKCCFASGASFSGYSAVMESWQLVFSWGNVADLQIRDVRTRVVSNMAWVTMKAYIGIAPGPYNLTSIYEFHNGRWCMVHHHSTALLVHGGGGGGQLPWQG
ncbi:F-box protein skip8 [Orobanche minor]